MGRVFLGPLSPEDEIAIAREGLEIPPEHVFVSSGSVAIRLLLRSAELPLGARVAIPALICPSVPWAIRAEGMIPAFMDIDANGFWMSFDPERLERDSVRAILLPHLYGMLHPQTGEIAAFAEDRGLPLFHDAAQSHGLTWQGQSIIRCHQGGFVSFGAGKSTTAAGGALVHGLSGSLVQKLRLDQWRRWNPYARRFLAERMGKVGTWRWYHRQPAGARASRLQVRAANYVRRRFADFEEKRRRCWQELETILGREVLGCGRERVSCYKFVIHRDSSAWQPPESLASLPWRRVEKYPAATPLPRYDAWKGYLYEFSTERSLAFFRGEVGDRPGGGK
ncbi:MAG: DegT/DnrJ/EryC1/StrS aminotransferase family protein [Magnetococcales bacterium]|nr:DegT/DnrJ/EryC1/StrS aminotransferase family protein [Magnetococcales bacterium]